MLQKGGDPMGQVEFLRKWLSEEKLDCSELLGDLVLHLDYSTALAIYMRAEAHHKVYPILFQQKMFDKLFPYVRKFRVKPEISALMEAVSPSSSAPLEVEHSMALLQNGIFTPR